MKIVEIIPQLKQGGAERFVVDLCNEIAQTNEVILLIFYKDNVSAFFSKELSSSVRIVYLNKCHGIDFKLILKVYKFLYIEKPDIVHTHLRGILYVGLACMLKTKIKYFHTIHSDASKEAGGILGKLCRKFFFHFGYIHPITISEESQQSFKDFYGLPSTLIYNGRPVYVKQIDVSIVAQELSDLKTNKNAKLIVNVARLSKEKNQVTLAYAIDELNRKGYSIELVIIGDISDRSIVSEIEMLNSPYVHLLGVRSNPRDYMMAADAFCLTSNYEGMPITLIECFSVGAIPLCTPVGGIKNMIRDGVNGLLAKSPIQSDLEDLFFRFLSLNKTALDQIRYNSKESFYLFDMVACAEKYVKIFNG